MSSKSANESSAATRVEIVDVRLQDRSFNVGESNSIPAQIIQGLTQPWGRKELPTQLLYSEQGLRLYDDITTKAAEAYYLFPAEQGILKAHADEIVQSMHGGGKVQEEEVVLELGAGSLRKTSHLLLGLSRLVPSESTAAPITYYALDLERGELERTLGDIESDIGSALDGKVTTKGMWGTYDGGLNFVQGGGLYGSRSCSVGTDSTGSSSSRDLSPVSVSSLSDAGSTQSAQSSPEHPEHPPLHILFLGSSLGNFGRDAGTEFLRSLPLRAGCGDTLLIGLDHDNNSALIENAYNDAQGHTRRFIMNALKAAGAALGDKDLFDENNWEYVNIYNTSERRHEAYFKSKCDQQLQEPSSKQVLTFVQNELLKIEVSHKFSTQDAHTLFTGANLRPIQRWIDPESHYSLWLLERPAFSFPLLSAPSPQSSFGVPSLEEWDNIWVVWDFITLKMIPSSMLMEKPIDLRHICLFYLGHIPTFLDVQLSKLFDEPNTEPEKFKYIFERGIDPNVDDPTSIHPHSEVPQNLEDWPPLAEILQFQSRVRTRLAKIYEDVEAGILTMTRKIGRVLFMTYEHEAMHIETLLYMLLQRAGSGTIPPSGFTVPPWESLAVNWRSAPAPTTAVATLGPAVLTLGLDDAERDDSSDTAKPVAEHTYGWDNENGVRTVDVERFSIEWRPITNEQFYQFYKGEGNGHVKFPASWVSEGGEIYVRTLYGPVPLKIAFDWPVITSFEDLSKYAKVQGGRIPTEPELRLFFDKFDAGYEGGANVGFRNWHPVPSTTGDEKSGGRGHNGGIWEWTSSNFDTYDGFEASTFYPGYSSDFFDNSHNVVLGGSYVTVPRIADRRSYRNWFQRNYPFAWVGARVAYDA